MALFLDLSVLALLALFAVMGAKRGLIGEVFRFAAMLGGFLISFMYYRDLQGIMEGFSSNQSLVGAAAFIIIFLAAFMVITGIGALLQKLVKIAAFGWADRILGLLLGALKAGVIAWAACLSISSIPVNQVQEQFGQSFVYKTYNAAPDIFSLDSMEKARAAFRNRSLRENDAADGDADANDEEERLKWGI